MFLMTTITIRGISPGVTSIEKGLFYFAIIDILFLPYSPVLAMTNSQIIVFLWLVIRLLSTGRSILDKRSSMVFCVFLLFVITCTATSFLFIPPFYLSQGVRENVLRALQLISSFGYLFFFEYVLERVTIRWDVILFSFVIYAGLWAVIYLYDFTAFLSLKRVFNPYDSFIGFLSSEEGYDYRFSFIWTDPNNITYAIAGVMVFLITWKHYTILPITLITVCVLLVCVSSRSTGGWLSLLFASIVLFYTQISDPIARNPLKRVLVFSAFVLVFIATLYVAFTFVFPQDAIDQSISRFNSKGDDASRLAIWRRLFEDKADLLPMYLVYGTGYQVYVNGSPYNVHNGHFLLIIAYGMIGYIAYMLLLFRKPKNVGLLGYAFSVPFILAITINTYIGEAKAVGLMMFLIAIMRTQAGSLSINGKVHK